MKLYKTLMLTGCVVLSGPLLLCSDEPHERSRWKSISLAGADDTPAPGADNAKALADGKTYFIKKKDSIPGLNVKEAKLTDYGGGIQLYIAVAPKDASRLREFIRSHTGGYIALMCEGNLITCPFIQTADVTSEFTVTVGSKTEGNRLLEVLRALPK